MQELRSQDHPLPDETLQVLLNHKWPGNDFELATTIKRAVSVSEDGIIKPNDVYFDLKQVEGEGKFNLLRLRPVKQAMTSPLFPRLFEVQPLHSSSFYWLSSF